MTSFHTNNYSPNNSNEILEMVLRRDRELVILLLAIVIVACWLYLLTGAGTGMYPHKMATLVPMHMNTGSSISKTITKSDIDLKPVKANNKIKLEWTLSYSLLMFWMWWLMMIAMMLPSAAPMVLLYSSVTRKGFAHTDVKHPKSSSFNIFLASTSFIIGYLVMWGFFSLVAVVAQWILVRENLLSTMMMSTSNLLGCVLLIAAGIWQLTPLKRACLHHCRSPIYFLSANWHPGIKGAFSMGIKHGLLCLGCCWFLMALLFYGGVMNLIWIIGLALIVLVEKVMPAGIAFGKITGFLLIAWGIWLGINTLLS